MRTYLIVHLAFVLAGIVSALPGSVIAQTNRPDHRYLPPHRPHDHIETSTQVTATLDGSILQVRCEQTFYNTGWAEEEVEVLLPVPADAVVTDGLLMADGREYRAEVLPADEARSIYEEIVRSRRDPALLELVGHGLVRLSAFPIPPGGRRMVSFRYHQPIPTYQGRTRMVMPVAALCGIDRIGPLEMELMVEGDRPVSQIYSPSHDLEINRIGSDAAEVIYIADPPDLRETLELIVLRDQRSIGFDLRTADGEDDDYFLLAVSPGWELLNRRRDVPQTQIFVLDTSGSMEGEKFAQARHALHIFLNEISSQDRFNLIAFSDDVRPLFREGPQRATPNACRHARDWLDRLRAGGGTAIADAIEEACRPRWEADLVLFMTDGLPTVGQTEPSRILNRLSRGYDGLRFFAFGVGYDVDAKLLDDLADRGSGSVSYVKPGENVSEAVTTLRRRVEHPCARNVTIRVQGANVFELFPEAPPDLFAGEPLLFTGRVDRGARRATIELRADGPGGRRLSEQWRVDFDDPRSRSSSVPVIWASRKVASLINQIRREGYDEATHDELYQLSKRYGILNEEVALLAREDEPLVGYGQTPPPQSRPQWGTIISNYKESEGGGGSLSLPDRSLAADEEVKVSAEAWRLKQAGAVSTLQSDLSGLTDVQTIEGVTFRLEEDTWTDTRLDGGRPRGTMTIKVRAYGSAYFRLAGDSSRLAAWMGAGERVKILLDGIVLEVGPDGDDTLSEDKIKRILDAVD